MLGGVASRKRKYISILPELGWQTYNQEEREKK